LATQAGRVTKSEIKERVKGRRRRRTRTVKKGPRGAESNVWKSRPQKHVRTKGACGEGGRGRRGEGGGMGVPRAKLRDRQARQKKTDRDAARQLLNEELGEKVHSL